MKRADLDSLAEDPFDVLIIGGGIYGMMALREAALRGLRAALVEKDDFGGATSHNSLKVMHGGIRYVQHLDFGRMRASVRERAFWQFAAPQLARPMQFLIPLLGMGVRGPLAFWAATRLYRMMGGKTGPGYEKPGVISARHARDQLGDLAPQGLTGGGVWRDGHIEDINRLHQSVLLSATDCGAMVANHMQAVALEREGDAIIGARLRDILTGAEALVRAKVTLCCCGAATPDLVEAAISGAGVRLPGFARATNLVIDRPATDAALGFVSQSTSDAVVDRGGRMFFMTPWRGRSIIGTHEAVAKNRSARDHTDIDDFLTDIAQAAPALKLTKRDVLWVHQGLIPANTDDGPDGVRRMTRGTLVDHAEADRVGGLISSVGVKYTTARLIAERAITRASLQIGRGQDASASLRTALILAESLDVDAKQDAALDARLRVAFEAELAVTLEDAVIRRTSLAEQGAFAKESGLLERVVNAAMRTQHWDDTRKIEESARLAKALAKLRGQRQRS